MNFNTFLKNAREGNTDMVSKADEIRFLFELHESLKGSGLYLASLFSYDLACWAQSRIESDLPPDLAGDLSLALDEKCDLQAKAYEMASQSKRALESANAGIDMLNERIERMQKEIAFLSEQSAERMDKIGKQAEKLYAQGCILSDVRELCAHAWLDGEDISPEQLRQRVQGDWDLDLG